MLKFNQQQICVNGAIEMLQSVGILGDTKATVPAIISYLLRECSHPEVSLRETVPQQLWEQKIQMRINARFLDVSKVDQRLQQV